MTRNHPRTGKTFDFIFGQPHRIPIKERGEFVKRKGDFHMKKEDMDC